MPNQEHGTLNNDDAVCSPQEALGISFETEIARLSQPDCYFRSLATELLPKRDRLAGLLKQAGMEPIIPEGGYFMMADFSKLGKLSLPIFIETYYTRSLYGILVVKAVLLRLCTQPGGIAETSQHGTHRT